MAELKLSQIAASPSDLVAADTLVGVHGGNTDYQFTGTNILNFINANVAPAVGQITGLGTGVAGALGNTAGGAGGFALAGTNPYNLAGPITSVGNATSIASQTGTGTKFVVDTAPTIVGLTNSGNGAASASSEVFTGTLFTGGTGTTTFPQLFIQPTGTTAVTTWSTSGTIIGANVVSGFAGNFLDFHVAGGASLAKLDGTGSLTANSLISSNAVTVAGGSVLQFAGRGNITSTANTTIQLGLADVDLNASIVAQTLRTQGALTGGTTNQAGKDFTVIVSPGKGTGAGGSFIVQTAPAGSTGSTPNTPVTAMTVDSTGKTIIASGKQLQLGNSAVTGLTPGALAALTTATLTFTDSTGTVYRVPAITP